MPATIDRLIRNSPYEEPKQHWRYDRETRSFELLDGRRPAGYIVATPGSRAFDDPGVFHELPLVNLIRPRVRAWRNAGYPGATGITRRLLEYWNDSEEREDRRFFFCQLEAIETLIWLTEAPEADRQGIDIPSDGGPFARICSKMATGSGKTVVMAMLIAWQVLNKVTYPTDRRFSRNILVVAPGLTVRNRLQVLVPSSSGNFYDEFRVVPVGLLDQLRQGKVRVMNWHGLGWETDEQLAKRKSVDKRGAKSDEAYVREVLGELASAQNLLMINDEAHHAWRVPVGARLRGVAKEEVEEATKWVGGLDRIHRARGILCAYDFSATPFTPSGHQSSEEALFDWIVSDFGLNDAIESGLVKTPRVVVRDDGRLGAQLRSRLYHIYMDRDVHADLNRPSEPEAPLPDLVKTAYVLLSKDWAETAADWESKSQPAPSGGGQAPGGGGQAPALPGYGETAPAPPVMITVANRTHTAARVAFAFEHHRIDAGDVRLPKEILHIDSRVLAKAEAMEGKEGEGVGSEDGGEAIVDAPAHKESADERATRLRETVDTIGQPGKLGARIEKVISVGMLSEGWDARTVTHIMGLRAFTSQLLCEQVVGRGLRRTSYEVNAKGRFEPEYVNIFGVPFTFLPHESHDGPPPPPPAKKTRIEPVAEKRAFEIRWPNVVRIDRTYEPRLTLDLARVPMLQISALDTPTNAELAPILEGKPMDQLTTIDLEEIGRRQRWQRIVFGVTRDVYDEMRRRWPGNKEQLLGQIVRLVDDFVRSDRIEITPGLFNRDELRKRILLTLNMTKLVQHVMSAIEAGNTQALTPVFDSVKPVRSTGDMMTWYTGKPCSGSEHSHINFCVVDSTWEATEAYQLDRHAGVAAWAKNDHLGFDVYYVYGGVVLKYRPDFLIKLTNGTTLVLEVKGQDSPQNRQKRGALDEWVQAVNQQGGFGRWAWDVSYDPADVLDVLAKHAG